MKEMNKEVEYWKTDTEKKDREIEEMRRINKRLNEEKRLLLEDFKKLDKIKAFVRSAEKSGKDKAEEIKIHIDYEVKLF